MGLGMEKTTGKGIGLRKEGRKISGEWKWDKHSIIEREFHIAELVRISRSAL